MNHHNIGGSGITAFCPLLTGKDDDKLPDPLFLLDQTLFLSSSLPLEILKEEVVMFTHSSANKDHDKSLIFRIGGSGKKVLADLLTGKLVCSLPIHFLYHKNFFGYTCIVKPAEISHHDDEISV